MATEAFVIHNDETNFYLSTVFKTKSDATTFISNQSDPAQFTIHHFKHPFFTFEQFARQFSEIQYHMFPTN